MGGQWGEGFSHPKEIFPTSRVPWHWLNILVQVFLFCARRRDGTSQGTLDIGKISLEGGETSPPIATPWAIFSPWGFIVQVGAWLGAPTCTQKVQSQQIAMNCDASYDKSQQC